MGRFLDYVNSTEEEEKKKKKEQEQKVETPSQKLGNFAKYVVEDYIGFDTFESDYKNVIGQINSATSGWQTQETMKNTKASIEQIRGRVDAFEKYQKQFGNGKGVSMSDSLKSLDDLLKNWDNYTSLYGQYKNADAFSKAKKTAEYDEKYKGKTFDEIQYALSQLKEGSDEHTYLMGYTNYTNLKDFDKALARAKGGYVNSEGKLANTEDKFKVFPSSSDVDKATKNIGKGITLPELDIFPSLDKDKIPLPQDASKIKSTTDAIKNFKDTAYNKQLGIDNKYADELERARNIYKLNYGVNDYYSHYTEEEDFEELSQYTPSELEGWWDKATGGSYNLGYGDITYEYINDVDGARSKIKDAKSKFGMDTKNQTTTQEKKGYDKLNADEVKLYNYLYARDKKNGTDSAQKYLDSMEVALTKRVYDDETKMWKESADNPVGATIMSALSIPANIIGGITGKMESVVDAIKGKEYNPYGYYKTPANFASDTRQYVGENIAKATDGMEILGTNVPSFLYQTGMSIGDTVVGGATLGSWYSVVAGSNAFQQKAKELKEAGENESVVLGNAFASGLAEMAFEYISLDKLININNVDSFKKYLIESWKQAGIEGSEELATEVANIAFDEWFRGNNSQLSQMKKDLMRQGYTEEEAYKETRNQMIRQVGEALAGGILSGKVMGSVASAGNYSSNKGTGAEIRANDRVGDMWDMSAMTPQESETFKLYTEYFNKGVNEGNISDAKLGNLYNTAVGEAQEGLYNKKSSTTDKMNAVTSMNKLEKISTPNTEAKAEAKRQERVSELSVGEVTEVTATGNSVDLEGIKINNDEITLVTNEGEFSAKDLTFSKERAELVSYAEVMGEEKGSLLLAQYDGNADVQEYVDSFNLVSSYAEHNFSQDEILANKGVLSAKQAGAIYTAIVKNTATAKQNAIQKLFETQGKKMSYKNTIDDSVIDYTNSTTDGSKVNWNSLTDSQRKGVTFFTGLAKGMGLDAELITDGLERGMNGAFMVENGKILIDVYAGINKTKMDNDAKDTIVPTIGHEITHWGKTLSPEKYQALSESVFKVLAKSKKSETQLVKEEMARMASKGMETSPELARDEIIARACEDMLSMSETGKEIFNSLSESDRKSLLYKVKDIINDLVNWINELISHYQSQSKEATFLRQYEEDLNDLAKQWDAMFKESIEVNKRMQEEGVTRAELNDAVEAVGLQFDAESKSIAPSEQLSERTWSESEYVQDKEVAVNAIVKAIGVTKADAERYINNINSIAKMIADDRARLDYEPNMDEFATVLKSNSEYKWTLDMSTLCAKRLLFTGTFDAIQKALPNTVFDSDDIVGLRSLMMSRGYEVACGICYVESTRREIGTITADFIERYKESQKTGKPITRVNSQGKVVELKKTKDQMGTTADKSTDRFIADKDYTPTLADLNTTDIDIVKKEHPLVYEAYLNFMNARGQAKPKLLETRAEYKGEILKHFKSKSAVKSRNDAGGLRLQSFSDFEVAHLIDMMQVTLDMSRVGLMSQAYTKVPAFAEVFGDTGIKINLSLIAKDSGLDADGNLIFDDVEGINHEEAFRLRDKYSKNVGTILVGKNDAHIIKAMADPRIDYIIPFHKSSWKESLYDALGLTGYDDYTDTQNEKYIDKSRGTAKNFQPSEYWDYSLTGDENAKVYLEMCKKDGRIPKFPQFQGYEGYWKLLIDFKMYDNDGVGSPQTVVKPNFSMDEAMQILNAYEGGHQKLPVANDIVDDFVSEYKKNHPKEQYSDRDSEGTKLSDGQINYFKESQVRDENGNLIPVYHGTPNANFTVFRRNYTFFTDSKDMADSYSPNGEGFKGYLNITNPFVIDAMGERWSKVPIDAKMKSFLEEHGAGVFKEKGKWRTSPADIVYAIEDAIEEGTADYDGVIIKNVDDTGSYGNKTGIIANDYIALNSNQFKNADNLNPTSDKDIRYSDRDVEPITEEDYKTMKKHFGTTGNFNVAGYMLQNGTILDFSGKHWGATTSRTRQVDHRDIQEVIPDENNGVDSMIRMISNGNIRLMPETGGINLSVAPSKNQRTVLRRYIEFFKGEIAVDIDRVGGDTIESFTYDKGTSADRIMRDIDNYFRGGRQSDLMRFHTMYSSREIIGASGTSYGMGVYLDSNLLTGLTDSERKEMVREYVISELAGEHFIAYDSNNNAVDIGIAKKSDTIKNRNGKKQNVLKELHHKYIGQKIKQEAVVLIDELIANASYDTTRPSLYPHDWLDNYGKNDWDYWKVYIQEKNKTVWEATLIIANTANGDKILYDIDPIKKVEEAIKSASTTTNNNVHQNNGKSQQQNSDRDIDSWLDKLTLDELLADLIELEDLGIDTTSEDVQEVKVKKQRAKRRVDEVNKRLKEIGLSFNGTKTVAWTDERIKTYLSGGYYGASNPDYAQAYITYMTPQQFLNLTMGGHEYTVDTILRESESYGELDFDKIANSEPIHLDIEEGKKGAKVYGHEGRHRMHLLGKAGFEKVPVLLFDTSTKYTKTNKESLKLETQKFYNDAFISKTRDVVVSDLIPFSQGNRDLIIEKFGSGNTVADVRFSDRDTESAYDLVGEADRLATENKLIQDDVGRLKERNKIMKEILGDFSFKPSQLKASAKHLLNISQSTYSEDALVKNLNSLYSYIVSTPKLEWDSLTAKCYEVADYILAEQKGKKVEVGYFRQALNDIRNGAISLSEEQIAEAKNVYGDKYRNALLGRVVIANNGTSLDQKWSELSQKYPELFKMDVPSEQRVTELSDIYDSLKESASVYEKFYDMDNTRQLAVEIYNQFWNVTAIKDVSDKYKKRIQKLNFDHRQMMSNMRKDYEQRLAEQKKADRSKYSKLANELRDREKTRVQEAKEFGRRRLHEYKDRAEKNAKIKSITDKALVLNKWLTKNSKDEHIAEPLKKPVAYLLDAIDFSSKQLLGMKGGQYAGMETKKDISLSKALEQVHDMARGIESSQIGEDDISSIYGTFADFPAGFADDVRDLSGKVNDIMRSVGDNEYVLNQMTLEELETLDKIITTMKSTVTKMNKFLAVRHAQGVAHMSQESINYLDSLGKGKVEGKLKKLLNWGNALPYYAFKRFGEGGQKVYEALMDGWDKFAFHTKAIIDYAEKTYTAKEIKEWERDIKTIEVLEPVTEAEMDSDDYEPTYQTIQMTVPQIMSLYCLQKREQAKSHLIGGGIRIADIETKKGSKKNVISQSEGVTLSESEINKIIGNLTDRQIEVADKLQEFMNTTCTDWGNEVSMLRFGYKAFGEENYFPIQSDKNNLAVNDETENQNSLFRLLNMSFTKSAIKKANNRVVISDIFDVFAQHTSDMAKYNALALPILDSFKWYNYKEKSKQGETQHKTKSLKQSLENAFGTNAQSYITTFLRDINGADNSSRDTIGKHFFTNAKIASVGMNLRVVLLQPTSYLRASAVIDNRYLIRALAHKPKIAKAEKYCGIAQWKALGFYDTNIQRGVTELIKHDETVRDKAVEVAMKGAEMADKLTWGVLWNACELEVRAKQKDLKVGSDEFNNAVAKRLREVIYATQVVDSTMTRSQMMRSSDMYDKMLTSFASEPTLSYNMMQDAIFEIKLAKRRGESKDSMRKHGRHFARVAVAYTVTNLMCALVEAGFDAYRDDEDEEMDLAEFMKAYLRNFATDMSFTAKVPYIKEIISILQGYTSSRTDTQWMQSLGYSLKGIAKIMEGEGNAYTTFKNILRASSYVSGLPFYNVWRDGMSFLNKTDIMTAEELEEAFNEAFGIE